GLTHNFITSINEDKSGILWVGTVNGLNHFDKKTNQFTHYFHNESDQTSLSGNNIQNIIEDDSGLLWVNSYNSGINKSIKISPDKFYRFQNRPEDATSLSNNNVLSITEGKDFRVWVGTNYGLNYYNPETGETGRVFNDSPRKNIINALATDFDGDIWIGSNEGMAIFNPYNQNFYEPEFNGLREAGLLSTRITSFLIDSLTVWIGTYNNGLYKLDRQNNTLSKFSFEGKHFNNYHADFILSLYKDKHGKIWVGTYGGLMMYNQTDNSFTTYSNNLNDNTSISNNYIFCIFEDSKKELWVGTANGLNRFIYGSSTFEHFFEKDGLPNSVICSIVEDFNADLWISTNKGISKFNYDQKLFTNFDVSNGTGGNLFNPSAGLSGVYTNIVFGGNQGFTIFYPGDMNFSEYNPKVLISSIKKINSDGESSLITSFTNEVEINSSEKTLLINFVSLDFSNPLKNKYTYMLEGVDNKWINAGYKNSATYTNLDPGEYILKVKGTNSDGVFSESVAQVKIIIVPAFYQTWWFQLTCLAILILCTYFIVRWKVREKIRRTYEIQKIREEESSNIRKQTAIDFHDELGHRLTRISLLSEMIRKKLHNTFNDVDPLLKKISENSQNLYEGTRDFIWAIDPAQDTLYDLIIRLKDFGDELFSSKDIKLTVKGIDESLQKFPLSIDWKRHVTLIFKEAMNNTLKYSECKNATLEILVRNGIEAEIFLFDDGKGFDSERLYDGNGLKNMKKRGEKINGKTDIDSRLNIGTKVLFKGIIPDNYIDYSRNVA
ncbi:MAG TPA: two-component regulator propeller domain-containing protein, partial [Ignavibacteriaceae bacterium]|nr:two-component regulator propeller domain-containing protein [Ignavibacteriaceae bacterium]